jgi:hypothetical protein
VQNLGGQDQEIDHPGRKTCVAGVICDSFVHTLIRREDDDCILPKGRVRDLGLNPGVVERIAHGGEQEIASQPATVGVPTWGQSMGTKLEVIA